MGSPTFLDIVVVVQAFASTAMTGLIWTIQLVQYPVMREVPASSFIAFETQHTRRISWVVGPLMAAEGVCVLILLVARPAALSWWLPWAGAVAEAAAIGVTALISAPIHGRLSAGKDDRLLERLIATNWIRTAAWTLRGALSLAMLVQLR